MGGESHFSGGSSVSSGYGRRRNVVLCKCGEVAPVVTTWTNENGNIGRRFYGCGRFKVMFWINCLRLINCCEFGFA